MKIAILTWFFGNNYGARAHTYALRNTIEQMGHTCEFINFVPKDAWKINLLTNINCTQPRLHPYLVAKCLLRCARFWYAKRLNVHGKKVNSAAELDDLHYDAVVLGSDAILNIHHPLFDGIYYGYGIKRTPYFFYAPSCEYMSSDNPKTRIYEESVKKAVMRSARDNHTKIIMDSLSGEENRLVLDPTLLWDFRDISKPLPEDKYLLVYSFSDWAEYSEPIRKYAQENGMRIISVGRYCSWADKTYDAASFQQWLGAFEKAAVVFTDSYHGTIFAVKNKKPLIITARDDKQYKINDFLSQLNLEDLPFYDGEDVEKYLSKASIDYAQVAARLETEVSKSKQYLHDVLQQIEASITTYETT